MECHRRELVNGDVDLVCSAATITSERQQEVDFCSPHLDITLSVVGITGMALKNGSRCFFHRVSSSPTVLLPLFLFRSSTSLTNSVTVTFWLSGEWGALQILKA